MSSWCFEGRSWGMIKRTLHQEGTKFLREKKHGFRIFSHISYRMCQGELWFSSNIPVETTLCLTVLDVKDAFLLVPQQETMYVQLPSWIVALSKDESLGIYHSSLVFRPFSGERGWEVTFGSAGPEALSGTSEECYSLLIRLLCQLMPWMCVGHFCQKVQKVTPWLWKGCCCGCSTLACGRPWRFDEDLKCFKIGCCPQRFFSTRFGTGRVK